MPFRRNDLLSCYASRVLILNILTGLGPQNLGPADGEPATHVIYLTETKPPKECSVQDLVNEPVRRALTKL